MTEFPLITRVFYYPLPRVVRILVSGRQGPPGESITFTSIEALRANTQNPLQELAYVADYYEDGSGAGGTGGEGGGFFRWAQNSSHPDDGLYTIVERASGKRWKRIVPFAGLNQYQAGAFVNDETEDTDYFAALLDDAATGRRPNILLEAGTALIGEPGSNKSNVPLKIPTCTGLQIVGVGDSAFLKRTPGYARGGLTGTEGGGGWHLISMKDEDDLASDMLLANFKIGNEDPDHDALGVGGHIIKLRMRRSMLRDLIIQDSKGQALVFDGNDNIIDGLRFLNANIEGGTAFRMGLGSNNTVRGCKGTSADDAFQLNVDDEDIDVDDPTNKVARNNTYVDNHFEAEQGSHFSVQMGGRHGPIRSAATSQAHTTLNDPVFGTGLLIRLRNGNPSVGDKCMVSGATGGGGVSAGNCNGERTVTVVPDEDDDNNADGKEFTLGAGSTPGSDGANIGNNTRCQFLRIGTTSGSPIITIKVPNHGTPSVATRQMQFANWGTKAGITSGQVGGIREATYVDASTLSFTADANANATISINDAANAYLDPSVSLLLLTDVGTDNTLFLRHTGSSGDSVREDGTTKGGFGRKFLLTGYRNISRIAAVDCETEHRDSGDRCCTRVLSYAAGIKLKFIRDRIRTPRGAALFFEANLDGYGIDPNAEAYLEQCDYDEAQANEWPTILFDGGGIRIRGGIIRGNGHTDVIRLGNSYSLTSYNDGSRTFDCDTNGINGAYSAMQFVDVDDLLITGIGDGCVGIDLGNVLWGNIGSRVRFQGANGSTTHGGIRMRTATGSGPGTTNVLIRDGIDWADIDNTRKVINLQAGQGNRQEAIP